MTLQFIHDNKGNTTGVFIPIEEWQILKSKYSDLQKEEAENVVELTDTCAKVLLINKTQKQVNAVKILLFIFLKFNKFIIIYVVVVSF
jgi:hypothetical protein